MRATATTFLLLVIVVTVLILPSEAAGDVIAQGELDQFPSCGRVIENYVMGNTPVDGCWDCHNVPSPTPPMETLGSPPPVSAIPPVSEPGLVRLTSEEGDDTRPVWSPDGDRIAWVTDRTGNWTIWVMDADGGNKMQLTSSDKISGWPCWSPDGKRIVYWSWSFPKYIGKLLIEPGHSDIWVMDPDGSNKVQLTSDTILEGAPQWSPDGNRILYDAYHLHKYLVYPSPCNYYEVVIWNWDLWVMNAEGSNQTPVEMIEFHNQPEHQLTPLWSPDGSRIIVFTFLPPSTELAYGSPNLRFSIVTMDADGSNQNRISLTEGYELSHPQWSPDGSKIAYVTNESPQSVNYTLGVMDADGSNPTRLTFDGRGDRDPSWSPDGDRILYWSWASGNPDVWVINADGSNPLQLTRSEAFDIFPAWSPDGTKVAFSSNRAPPHDQFDIFIVSAVPTLSTSTLSISLSSDIAEHGSTITISGSTSPAIPGTEIDLTYTRPDKTTVSGTAVTSTAGSFSHSLTANQEGMWSVKASWIGNDGYHGAESPTLEFTVLKSPGLPLGTVLTVFILFVTASVLVTYGWRKRRS